MKLFNIDGYRAEANLQPYITRMYFSNVETRPAVDVDSSRNSLRGTLKSLQVYASCIMGIEYSFSSVYAVSDLQLYCTSIAGVSRGSAGILFSRCISQFEENGFAGMAIP